MSIEAGDQFGRWLVVRRAESGWLSGKSRAQWVCRCACGFRATVFGRYLSAGKSLGCSTNTGQTAEEATACRRQWERDQATHALRDKLLALFEEHRVADELVAAAEAVFEAHARNPQVASGMGATGSDTVTS